MVATLLLLTVVSRASATALVYEGFDYTVGQRIIGQTNPVTTDTWKDPTAPAQPAEGVDTQLIVSGNVSYPGLPESVGNSLTIPADIQSNIARLDLPGRPHTITGPNQSLFFSFTMKLTSIKELTNPADAANSAHQAGAFFAGFTASTGGMSGANVYAGQVRLRREIVEGLPTGRYQLGIHKSNFAGGFAKWDITQSFELEEEVLLVGQYQYNTVAPDDDYVRLWLNPAPGEPAPPPNVEDNLGYDVTNPSGSSQGNINSFWFRSDGSIQLGNLNVDELRIATTFDEVVPGGSAMGLAGDYDQDSDVDGADFLLWQTSLGNAAALPNDDTLGVAGDDLQRWKDAFGDVGAAVAATTVPEPTSLGAAVLLSLAGMARLGRRPKHFICS
jgi:hypothetical protein